MDHPFPSQLVTFWVCTGSACAADVVPTNWFRLLSFISPAGYLRLTMAVRRAGRAESTSAKRSRGQETENRKGVETSG